MTESGFAEGSAAAMAMRPVWTHGAPQMRITGAASGRSPSIGLPRRRRSPTHATGQGPYVQSADSHRYAREALEPNASKGSGPPPVTPGDPARWLRGGELACTQEHGSVGRCHPCRHGATRGRAARAGCTGQSSHGLPLAGRPSWRLGWAGSPCHCAGGERLGQRETKVGRNGETLVLWRKTPGVAAGQPLSSCSVTERSCRRVIRIVCLVRPAHRSHRSHRVPPPERWSTCRSPPRWARTATPRTGFNGRSNVPSERRGFNCPCLSCAARTTARRMPRWLV